MSKSLIVLVALLLAPVASADEAPKAPDLSADIVTTFGGGSTKGRFYVSGGRIRTEIGADGDLAILVDPAARKSWMLTPMGCTEQEMSADEATLFDSSVPVVKQEVRGEETIDGHPTKKIRITTEIDGNEHTMIQWRAADLGNLPIQWSALTGPHLSTLKNVQLGKPDPALFQIPDDCKVAAGLTMGIRPSDTMYQQRCDAGDAFSCGKLGWLYEHGRGVAKDEARATALYHQACHGGHALSCGRLGGLYAFR